MAGGTWSLTNQPVLPGLYMNFVGAAGAAIQPGARGVVVAPVKAHWGPVGEFVEVTSETAIRELFTEDEAGGATAFTTLYLALLGGPNKLLAYRMADSTAAPAQLALKNTETSPVDCVRLSAKYPGERGNRFTVSIQPNSLLTGIKELKLYEGGTLLRTISLGDGEAEQAVMAINQDSGNKWIVAEKLADGVVDDVTGKIFSGGLSGISGITHADYMAATLHFETKDFHVLTLDGVSDPALHTSLVAWLKRVREEGKGILLTLGGSAASDTADNAVEQAVQRSASFDYEGVIHVGSGAKLIAK